MDPDRHARKRISIPFPFDVYNNIKNFIKPFVMRHDWNQNVREVEK